MTSALASLFFQFGDTDLINFLLRLRRLIFRVFSKVWLVGDSILNPLNDAHSFDLSASSQLLFKSRMARCGHWKFAHCRMLMQPMPEAILAEGHNVRLDTNTGKRTPFTSGP